MQEWHLKCITNIREKMIKIPVVDYGAVQSTYNTNNNIEETKSDVVPSETEQILNGEVIFLINCLYFV